MFQSDNGMEYLTSDLILFCRERGIRIQKTVPRTPQFKTVLANIKKSLVS